MRYFFLAVLLFSSLFAEYRTNESCKECHEKIYEEYSHSQHAKSYFTDELHRKVADAADPKTYACAPCHMPAADNIADLVRGKARPDKNDVTHTDAISCYFCHTIAYVKKAHRFNINVPSRQAKGYKPTLYGRLDHPDDNDKHSSVTNPIYAKNVCLGCHAHKRNDHNVTIFSAMAENQDSLSCIKCHMPKIEGGAEKMDKRARGRHASHRFAGVHDAKMRAKGVDIQITRSGNRLEITLHNLMDHPLIIQPARMKYLRVELFRGKQLLWSNASDPRAVFEYRFADQEGRQVIIPAFAHRILRENNLPAKASRHFTYTLPFSPRPGDRIVASLFMYLAKPDCLKAIELKDTVLTKPIMMKKREMTLK